MDLGEAVPQYCDSVARECIAYSFYILLTDRFIAVSSDLQWVRCCAINVRTSWSLDVLGNKYLLSSAMRYTYHSSTIHQHMQYTYYYHDPTKRLCKSRAA